MMKGDSPSCEHFVLSFTQSEGTQILSLNPYDVAKVGLTFSQTVWYY